jgi:hypothetical protein
MFCSKACYRSFRRPALERFWEKVDTSGGPSACWLWTASLAAGYGQFMLNARTVPIRSHRFAWELSNGAIPDGLFVCHRCDVKACCNPSHMFLGTILDNTRDATDKGLMPRGERNGSAILNEATVRTILATPLERGVIARLAREHGVSVATIGLIVHRKNWRHVSHA